MSDTSTQVKPPAKPGEPDGMTEQEPVAEPMTVEQLASLAHDYQVPMSEETLKAIVGDGKEANPEKVQAFEAYLKEAAAGLFPTMAPQIRAGIKTGYLLDPYRQVGKRVLGDQFEPDFVGDPRSSAALSGGRDPKTGRPVPMTLDEWKQHLMAEPSFGWIKTAAGQRNLRSVMDAIRAGFNGGDSNSSMINPNAQPTGPAQEQS